jgi:hypothetical protein
MRSTAASKHRLLSKAAGLTGSSRAKLRELSAPFGFIDPDGVQWDVPAGFQTDGAADDAAHQVRHSESQFPNAVELKV